MTDYFTPAPILDDVLDELREAREMVVYLTRANEALTAQLESTLQDRKLILADRDRLRAASGDVIRETFSSYRQAEEAYAAHLKAEADNARLREALQQFLIEYDEVDLANAEPSSLTAAVLAARAVLKGETP